MDTLALAWSCGMVNALPERPRASRAAAVRVFAPRPGVVASIRGVSQARALDGIEEIELTVSAGTKIEPLQDSMERVGHVIATGATAREAIARCEEARDLVHFTMTRDTAARDSIAPLRRALGPQVSTA